MVLALFWGLFLLWKNIKLTSYKEEEVFDAFFVSLFGGLFISRLIYVGLNFEKFGFNILKFILINGYPGLSLFGLIAGSILILFLIFKAKKINVKDIFDYFVPATFVALAVGKLGSFFAGVDVGTKTSLLLSIRYVGYSGARHIVGIYESLLFFLGAFISYKILLNVRRNIYPAGFVASFFIFYFSATIFLLDNLKENHLYFVGRSINFAAASVLVVLFSAYFLYFFRTNIISATKSGFSKITKYDRKKGEQSGEKT